MYRILAVVGSLALALAAASVARAAPSTTPHVQNVGITVGAGDSVTEPNFAVAPGVPVRITVTNHTREFHTFTVPGLRLSELILPARGHEARRTVFTFTVQQSGAFAWHCLICPSGEHGRPHYMGGTIYAIIDPSALS